MFQQSESPINVVFLRDIEDTKIQDQDAALTWDGFVRIMSDFYRVEDKEQAGGIMPVKMKPQSEWVPSRKGSFRIDDNVESISVATIDIDNPGSLEKAKETYSDFDYVVHSTHSRSTDTPYKFRMYIKLEGDIKKAEWEQLFPKMAFPVDADLSCSNPSRGYYLPSWNPKSGLDPYLEINEGRSLTVKDIERIGVQYEKSLEKKALESGDSDHLDLFRAAIERAANQKSKTASEFIHPASGKVSNPITYSKIDLSYEGFKKRHQDLMDRCLPSGQRSLFSYESTFREIQKHGEHTDFKNLIKFITRASLEESPKPLHDVSSDTFEEMPRHIESACDSVGGIKIPVENIRSNVYEGIREARSISMAASEKGSTDDVWGFPKKPKKLGSDFVNPIVGTDFQSLKKENADLVKQYLYKDKDWAKLASGVINRMGGDKSNKSLYHAVKFSLYVMDGAHNKVFSEPINESQIKKSISDLKSYVSNGGADKEKMKAVDFAFNGYAQNMKSLNYNNANKRDGYPSP